LRLPLDLVVLEQRLVGDPSGDEGQLPAQVHGILHADVEALSCVCRELGSGSIA
jgi:hypothetical protein